MAERLHTEPSFQTILRHKRTILEENLPMDLSSLLIASGIIEPADQEMLHQTRKHSGLKASQKQFADLLISRKWMEEEVENFTSCLQQLNEEYLISKLFDKKIDETTEEENTADTEDTPTQDSVKSTTIIVNGDNNKVINDSQFEINNYK